MGRITITMDVYDEGSDEDNPTGVTNDTFDRINETLMQLGDDVTIERD
jgi:hypothetical protein